MINDHSIYNYYVLAKYSRCWLVLVASFVVMMLSQNGKKWGRGGGTSIFTDQPLFTLFFHTQTAPKTETLKINDNNFNSEIYNIHTYY